MLRPDIKRIKKCDKAGGKAIREEYGAYEIQELIMKLVEYIEYLEVVAEFE